MKHALKLVRKERAPIDIYAADKQRIAQTDWAALHTWSDRNPPLEIADRPRRGWRG